MATQLAADAAVADAVKVLKASAGSHGVPLMTLAERRSTHAQLRDVARSRLGLKNTAGQKQLDSVAAIRAARYRDHVNGAKEKPKVDAPMHVLLPKHYGCADRTLERFDDLMALTPDEAASVVRPISEWVETPRGFFRQGMFFRIVLRNDTVYVRLFDAMLFLGITKSDDYRRVANAWTATRPDDAADAFEVEGTNPALASHLGLHVDTRFTPAVWVVRLFRWLFPHALSIANPTPPSAELMELVGHYAPSDVACLPEFPPEPLPQPALASTDPEPPSDVVVVAHSNAAVQKTRNTRRRRRYFRSSARRRSSTASMSSSRCDGGAATTVFAGGRCMLAPMSAATFSWIRMRYPLRSASDTMAALLLADASLMPFI